MSVGEDQPKVTYPVLSPRAADDDSDMHVTSGGRSDVRDECRAWLYPLLDISPAAGVCGKCSADVVDQQEWGVCAVTGCVMCPGGGGHQWKPRRNGRYWQAVYGAAAAGVPERIHNGELGVWVREWVAAAEWARACHAGPHMSSFVKVWEGLALGLRDAQRGYAAGWFFQRNSSRVARDVVVAADNVTHRATLLAVLTGQPPSILFPAQVFPAGKPMVLDDVMALQEHTQEGVCLVGPNPHQWACSPHIATYPTFGVMQQDRYEECVLVRTVSTSAWQEHTTADFPCAPLLHGGHTLFTDDAWRDVQHVRSSHVSASDAL